MVVEGGLALWGNFWSGCVVGEVGDDGGGELERVSVSMGRRESWIPGLRTLGGRPCRPSLRVTETRPFCW